MVVRVSTNFGHTSGILFFINLLQGLYQCDKALAYQQELFNEEEGPLYGPGIAD